jgi:hypothetical protein
MKAAKTILAAWSAFCLLTSTAAATTWVNFANSSFSPLRLTDGTISPSGEILSSGTITEVLGTGSVATFAIGPASVRVELLAGANPGALAPILIGINDDSLYVTNYGGTLASAQGTFPGGTTVNLPPALEFNGSAPVFFKFRAWSIGLDDALSFSARLLSGAGFAGESEIIAPSPQASPALTALFGSGPNQWQDLTLYTVIPEPTSLALVVAGWAVVAGVSRRR